MTMLENLVLLDCYFIALAKSKRLSNLIEVIIFLESWHNIFKYAKEIFYYLEKNCPSLNSNGKPNKTNLSSKIE